MNDEVIQPLNKLDCHGAKAPRNDEDFLHNDDFRHPVPTRHPALADFRKGAVTRSVPARKVEPDVTPARSRIIQDDAGSINVNVHCNDEVYKIINIGYNSDMKHHNYKFGFTLAEVFHPALRKNAFTLAEVLITLGIIGIIAALTLPSLIADYKNKETVARLQKAISVLNNGTRLMMANEGVNEYNDLAIHSLCSGPSNTMSCRLKYYKKYFNIVEGGTYKSQDAYKIKCLNGTSTCVQYVLFSFLSLNFITSDGILYALGFAELPSVIDVNGTKGPNQIGRDVFLLSRKSDGTYIPYAAEDWDNPSSVSYCNPNSGRGTACVARIIAKGWKIDY